MVHADHLEEVIHHYENSGHWEELMTLLEQGIGLERAHVNMFTELAILYSKFRPEKLAEHLKLFHSKLNKSKVIRVCESNLQWKDATFLYINNSEFDNAALTMVNHSPECWDHVLFKDVMGKVGNQELCYRGIQCYLKQHPKLLDDLLASMAARIDATRVVKLARKLNALPLFYRFLQSVQSANLPAVNDALNELYVEEGNYADLRVSVNSHSEFDWQKLAGSIEKHAQLEFRRIAAALYRNNARFEASIELSKRDKLWRDVMETAAQSKSTPLAEATLRFFVTEKLPECFAACLAHCYELVRPDVALEIAWSNQMLDFVFPFLIQILREYVPKIRELDERTRPKEPELVQQSPGALQMAPQPLAMPMSMGPMGIAPMALGSLPPMPMSSAGFYPSGGVPQPYASAPGIYMSPGGGFQ